MTLLTPLQRHLGWVFTKIFWRDRRSIFFSLFFPLVFMTVFSFVNSNDSTTLEIGVVNRTGGDTAADFIQLLQENPVFQVTVGNEAELRTQLEAGDQVMVLILPDDFSASSGGAELTVVVDAAQVQQLNLILPVLERSLLEIERTFRNSEPMFSIAIEDVQARSQRYIDFLLPGLLAFTLMQLAVAGSGFNIVEYRRKGILKRLFVTPIHPRDFITGIVLARLGIVLVQLSLLMLFAVLLLDVRIIGNFFSYYLVVIFSSMLFLCMGFAMGSLAKTQESIGAIGNLVIFPQIFLSGVFYPISSMPEFIQPLATILPLSFVSTAMRDIANEGAALLAVWPSLAGIAAWLMISFIAATRMFVWKEVAA